MANQFKANYSEISAQGAELIRLAGLMSTEFGYINAQIDRIDSGAGIFDGDAAADIKSQIKSYSSDLHLFSDAVNSCGEFVQKVVATYEDVDTAAKKAVSGNSNGDSSHTGASSARL